MEEEVGAYENPLGEITIRIRDLEEKNRIIKDRTLLIGKNLIEIKLKTNEEMLEIKKELENIRQDLKKTNSFLEMVSKEFPNFARKEDVAILAKQAKMFQPLEFIKKSELKSLIKK
jgi:hypothetical protein